MEKINELIKNIKKNKTRIDPQFERSFIAEQRLRVSIINQ